MINRINHIGVAVKDVDEAILFFREKFGFEVTDLAQEKGFRIAFLPTENTPIELIQDAILGGIITKFIEKRGEGLHHIGFEVEDIRVASERLRSQGINCLDKEPKEGAHNTLVTFLHPRDTLGILIELIELPDKHK